VVGLGQAGEQVLVLGRVRLGLLQRPFADLGDRVAVFVEQVQGDQDPVVRTPGCGESPEPLPERAEIDGVPAEPRQIAREGLAGRPVLAALPLAEQSGMPPQERGEGLMPFGGLVRVEAVGLPLQVVEVAAVRRRQEAADQALRVERGGDFLVGLRLGLEQVFLDPGGVLDVGEAVGRSDPALADEARREPVRIANSITFRFPVQVV
jgi:hypothetical protein